MRFGGALNLHTHVHAVVSDWVFELNLPWGGRNWFLHGGSYPTAEELAAIVTAIRKKLIRRICGMGALDREAAAGMLSRKNPGFSIHEEVVIMERDRAALERLLRYCSRPAILAARLLYSVKANTAFAVVRLRREKLNY